MDICDTMKVKKKRAKTKTAASIGNGWLSTDEEEIERRRLRSFEESLKVKRIRTEKQLNESIYGDYLVSSGSDSQYVVEYRDKYSRINSCTCPDYQINGLSSCKHIERVSRFLMRKKAPDKRRCSEVFLNYSAKEFGKEFGKESAKEPVIEVLWADNLRANSKVKKLLSPYFSSDNTLLLASLDSWKTLEKHIYLTTSEVIEYVKNKFSVIYSLSGMRDLLHRLGYEYKKPKLVPGNPDILVAIEN